jgi:hypothetical protein
MFYTVTAIEGILTKKYTADLSNPKLKPLDKVVYWLIVIFVVVYPFATTAFLQWQGPKGLKTASIKDKFGSWYMLIDIKSRLKVCHTTVFLIRRLIIGISIAVLVEHYNFQLVILLICSISVSIFNFVARPFLTNMLNNLESVNELVILLSIIIMHSFSDAVDSETTRYTYGWLYVAIIFSTLILNLMFIGSYIVE